MDFGICTYNYKGVHLFLSFSPQLLGKKKKKKKLQGHHSLSIFFKEEIKRETSK